MPTCNKDSQFEYRECLDILFDIIQKYQETYKTCGDLNRPLLDPRNNKHDKLLLKKGEGLDVWPSSSHMDYVLVNDKNLVLNYINQVSISQHIFL